MKMADGKGTRFADIRKALLKGGTGAPMPAQAARPPEKAVEPFKPQPDPHAAALVQPATPTKRAAPVARPQAPKVEMVQPPAQEPTTAQEMTQKLKYELDCQLLKASVENDLDAAMRALENGADVNVRNVHDRTPLMVAAKKGHTKIAELLVAKGADVNAKDEDGRTALELAKRSNRKNRKEIVAVLRAAGAVSKPSRNVDNGVRERECHSSDFYTSGVPLLVTLIGLPLVGYIIVCILNWLTTPK